MPAGSFTRSDRGDAKDIGDGLLSGTVNVAKMAALFGWAKDLWAKGSKAKSTGVVDAGVDQAIGILFLKLGSEGLWSGVVIRIQE